MKRKLISLVLASSLGLTACHSGSSPNSDSATTSAKAPQVLTATANSTASNSVTSTIFSFIGNSMLESFSQSFFGFPGTWAATLLQNLIFGQQEDQTTKTLNEINEKLDTVLDGLKVNLNLTASVQLIVSEVYQLIASTNVQAAFQEFDDEITTVETPYSAYTTAKAFGESGTAYSVDEYYDYASKHCDDKNLMIALAESSMTTSSSSYPDVIYNSFYTNFVNVKTAATGGSSTFVKLSGAKSDYESAIISTLPANSDFMQKVNKYNMNVAYYSWNIVGALQKIYAMQLSQMTYHYACGKNFNFTNLGNLPTTEGKTGLEDGVKLLNQIYEPAYAQLQQNLNKSMPTISNTDVYSMVNSTLFKGKSLLDATAFNSNESAVGTCSLSNLNFNSYTNDGKTSGIAYLQAVCIASKSGSESNVKFESATIAAEIPYHTSNNTSVDRVGQSNIKYDTSSKTISSSVSSDSLEAEDVQNIFNLRTEMIYNGVYWANKESMNIIAPSWINSGQTTNVDRVYLGLNISGKNNVGFYTDKYTDSSPASYAERDLGSTFSYGNFVPPYDYASFTIDGSQIQRYSYVVANGLKTWGGGPANPWDKIVGWEYWLLGHYNGKTFATKVVFQHVGNSTSFGFNPYGNTNVITIQAMGIYCLTDECSRQDDGSGDNDNKTTLTWTDGTQVVADEDTDDMTGFGDLSYLYKTTITGSTGK